MFDIGFWELVVCALLALVVVGPERLPGALRALQRGVRAVRQFTSQVQSELNHELRVKELHEHLRKAEELGMDNLPPELQRSIAELRGAAKQVQRPYAKSNQPTVNKPKGDSDTYES